MCFNFFFPFYFKEKKNFFFGTFFQFLYLTIFVILDNIKTYIFKYNNNILFFIIILYIIIIIFLLFYLFFFFIFDTFLFLLENFLIYFSLKIKRFFDRNLL